MTKKIIWQNDEGGVSISQPTVEALAKYTIEQIAATVVPSGKKYAIVDASEVPTDRTFRNAWTVDEADLTEGVGSEFDDITKVAGDD